MGSTREKLIAARTGLVLDEPFFGTLALGLKLQEDTGCQTAWTDGRSFGYDPAFIDNLSHAQVKSLIAHEVMHCACGHPWRRDGRDDKRWNVAADIAINDLLADSGFTLPPDALTADAQQKGKSAEWIYARLPEPQPDDNGKPQDGQGQGQQDSKPNPQGEVRDAPSDADADGQEAPTEQQWQQSVQQAARAAKARGSLPGGLERFAADAVKPRVDWKAALRRFIQERAQSDYTWSRPNRRYMSLGLYLPSLESHELGEIAVAIDTSGSISCVTLALFEAEVDAIMSECRPSKINVIYADTKVQRVDSFSRDEAVTLKACGGGGTDFTDTFTHLEKADAAPACLIYLTDMNGSCSAQAPDYPVLWVSTERGHTAPFGELLMLED